MLVAAMGSRILISGGGIAGLTLAILLKEMGHEPVVIERDKAPSSAGYMMDFYGTGWDVAERMGLTDALRAVRYPIDKLQFVNAYGVPYLTVPMRRLQRALSERYVYLRRSDLQRILFERARDRGIEVRFGQSVRFLEQHAGNVRVVLTDGNEETVALVFGADGVHSRVRELCFGAADQFERFIGAHAAAFHLHARGYGDDRALKLHDAPGRLAAFYPLDDDRVDATFIFRHTAQDIEPTARLPLLREIFCDPNALSRRVLSELAPARPIHFGPLTQIVMRRWHKGRVALLGDACGCVTAAGGQGSHLAMAGAWLLAQELRRSGNDHARAFAAYDALLRPIVARKQDQAARLLDALVPPPGARMWLRRVAKHALFNSLVLPLTWRLAGSRSILPRAQ
jgi:2-polyprenyl-6-methoxyphenol hydroxylase-like FAD-dependent oxidoreductase